MLAISGGSDSTALLYALCAIKAEGVLYGDILCAHINHQLRGSESDGDEDFVIAQANKLNLAVTTKRLDVRGFACKEKLSIETAARKLRIDSLLSIAKANDCKWVTTAHQKDDNAETIIQRLVRGTGFRGLGGIWPLRYFYDGVGFVRPLLCVRRDEVVEYLKKRSIEWRTDRTNDDCSYRRNYIRHRLLPELQRRCSGSIVEELSELARSAQKFYGLVCREADKVWPEAAEVSSDKVELDLKRFSVQPQPVKVELVRRSLINLGSGESDLAHQHYERILEMAQRKTSGKRIELPDGFVVWREYESLVFTHHRESNVAGNRADEKVELQIPGRAQFGNFLIEATILEADKKHFEKFKQEKSNFVERFDLDKLKLPLSVRFRRVGDKFRPLGLGEEKRVGKFLTAAKAPRQIRERLLIVTDAEKIIWVWPVRTSELTKITATTKSILQIKLRQLE